MTEETEKITTEDINQYPRPNGKPPKRPLLRTMKSDMQEYIDRKKMSIVDIAGKQAEKQGLKISTTPTNWITSIITMVVIMLVIISVGIFGYTIIKKKNSQANKQTSIQNLPAPFVTPNEQKIITLFKEDKEQNKNIIAEMTYINAPIGNLTNFIFTDESKTILTSEQLFKSIDIKTPLGLSSFLTDGFMFGIYSLERNEPFVILKVRSYENIFALMLKWESTMRDNLNIIFPSDNASTSTGSIFQDIMIKNHDTRILYNQNGQTDILYTFLDKETIIITSSVETFEEILRRLSSPNL